MKSVRKALRHGEVEKDQYGRLSCERCEEELKSQNDPDEVYTIRVCPECGAEWKEI